MSEQQDKLIAAALSRLDKLRRVESFDPNDPGSKPTSAQQEVIDDFGIVLIQWIAAANRSGKSQTCGRIIAWCLTNTHPTWKMPDKWRESGMLVVVAARTGKHIEDSLWPKIRVCLEPGTYKEVRVGNILQKIEFIDGSKHRIVFQSLENPKVARERLQSYDAHIAWLDELVDQPSLITELALRVSTNGGSFLASFTPLIPAPAVKKMVDSAELPLAKKYVFKTLDNPVFQDDKARALFMASLAGLSQEEIDTRLNGTWSQGSNSVYQFEYEKMVEMPQGYSPLWRHVESVDPATQSKLGLTVWAEDPSTHIWYCVLEDYVKGIYVPTEIIKAVQDKTRRFNIVRRISDSEATWYIHQAGAMGIHYIPVYKKSNRKDELIKQLQQFLGTRIRLTPECQNLISELQQCRYSDTGSGKIVNSSIYHLADSAQYFCDNIPKPDTKLTTYTSWDEYLYEANEKRKIQVEKAKSKLNRANRMYIQRRR